LAASFRRSNAAGTIAARARQIHGPNPTHAQPLEVLSTHEPAPCGLRWQPAPSKLCEAGSAASTPLWKAVANSESGVALRFPLQSIRLMGPTSNFMVEQASHEP